MNEKLDKFQSVLEEVFNAGALPPDQREYSQQPSIAKIVQQKMNISSRTYYRRLDQLTRDGYIVPWQESNEFTVPSLDNPDMSEEELVDHVTRRFETRRKATQQRNWMPLTFHKPGPLAISFLGDPHVDDNGCNWPRLREDLHTINETDGMYAASLGDASNNWVGRLSRLWASQETSARQAWQLVQWLLKATDWCLLVKGNHDLWLPNDVDPIEWLKVPGTLTADWQARIEVRFPKGRKGRIWAAHDMPGHSQWNPLHAQVKRAKFSQEADLYISGHRHHWALAQNEDEWTNVVYWTARAKGYKTEDPYADRLGHGEQRHGQAITAVFEPEAVSDTSFMVCFANVQEAAEYLRWKRAKYSR
jgi:UDP-2,3-diacylglucosamine pyrophosphatase LpxH